MNFSQIKAIEKANKIKLVKQFGSIPDASGIYILMREENGFKYCYVGQAKRLLTRLAQHLSGYQHIDLSIKKHKLYSKENPTGWDLDWILYDESELDKWEQHWIKEYASKGYIPRNKTAGGQGEGKFNIAEARAPKGYYDGLKQGYKNAQKEIKHLFDLHLNASIKSAKPNKTQEKALQKFKDFLEVKE